MKTPRSPRLAHVLLQLAAPALAACGHTAPFGPADYGTNQPFGTGSLVRLTFNLGTDLTPAWLPDGSAFLYSAQRLDQPDFDRCLALMPATGGTIRATICEPLPAAADSTDVFEWPAVDPAGRLLYVRATSLIGATAPAARQLVLATLAAPTDTRTLLATPYTLPGVPPTDGVSQVRWLGPDRFVYLAERVVCQGSPLAPCGDTVTTGLEIVRADLAGDSVLLQPVPGTAGASSVAVGGGGDTIYYTLNGDTRVYRQALSGAAASVVYDFGAEGIARDAQVVGNTLVAVVGGKVTFAYDSVQFGFLQVDRGGVLRRVDLATGADSLLHTIGVFFRHPALAPSGTVLVGEGYATRFDSISVGPESNPTLVIDTVVARSADIWLVRLP